MLKNINLENSMVSLLNRREFVLKSALAFAAGVLHASSGQASAQPSPNDGLKWEKAPCRFCGTGCGVMVGVKDGRVVAVQGDVSNPVNKGLLCAKGYHAGAAMYGRDRLRYPLMRKGGKLTRVSWDEAINTIARYIKSNDDSFAIYGSGQWTITEGYTAMKLLKGGCGSNHLDPNARLCMASAVVGMLTTYGVDEPSGCYDDMDVCDTVVLWGNNMAEMHPVLWSRIVDRRARGEKIEIFDLGVRRTRTTEQCDHYLEFNPQSDLAIANGLCHLLIKWETYDKKWVEEHCNFRQGEDASGKPMSFEQYVSFLEDYTPEKVEKISGVSVAKLEILAKRFADRERKIISFWCMGMNQHTRGTWINNLVYNIHFISGQFGASGKTAFSLTGQPSACGTCREVGTLAHALPGGRVVMKPEHRAHIEKAWKLPAGRINPKPGHHAVSMFQALETNDLTGCWVQVTNPAQTMPNLNEVASKLKDRFLVVSDIYPTATSKLATIVLPSAVWVEKNGVFGNSERRTQQWFKMIDPPGEARDDVWQMIAVAHRLYELGYKGMTTTDGEFLFTARDENGKEIEAWKWEEFRSHNVDKILYEEYRPLTHMKRKNVAPYDELAASRGLRWPVTQDETGNWVETKRRFVEGEDPYVKKGRSVDFYWGPDEKGKARIWARPYKAAPEEPDEEYPFWLCTGRVLEHWHTGTMTRRVPQFHSAMPKAYVELHPKDAARFKISTGDRVKIVSRRGELTLQAWINGRSLPKEGFIFVPFFDESLLINKVTLHAYDAMSKEPDYKKCAVRIEKV